MTLHEYHCTALDKYEHDPNNSIVAAAERTRNLI